MAGKTQVPAVEGWFTTDADRPALLGTRCTTCGTRSSSRGQSRSAATPQCTGREFDERRAVPHAARSGRSPTTATSRRRRTSRRRPVRAVRASPRSSSPPSRWSCSARSCPASASTTCTSAWRWSSSSSTALRGRRARVPGLEVAAPSPRAEERPMSSDHEVAVLGVGMHPWGKWGRNFVEYGVVAARAALADAGARLARRRSSSPAPTPCATATRATSPARPSRRRSAGRASGSSSCYGACASGAMAIEAARAQILAGLCDVALVVGADTTPKGFLAPDRRRPPRRSRLAALPPARRHQPDVLRALRPPPHGPATAPPNDDFAQVKVKNGRHGLTNPNARYRKEVTRRRRDGLARSSPTRCGCSTSARPPTAAPRSCSRRWSSPQRARADRRRCASRPSRRSRRPTRTRIIEMPELRHRLGGRRSRRPTLPFRDVDRRTPPTRRPGSAPTTSTSPRSTTCRPRSSSTGTRTSGSASDGRGREAAARRRHDARRPRPGQPERRPGLLRRGRPRPGHRPGVRAHLAAPRPGRRPPGRGRHASASPSTRACSATARRSSSPADPATSGSTTRTGGDLYVPGRKDRNQSGFGAARPPKVPRHRDVRLVLIDMSCCS